jgi:hypothetical protein
VFRQRWSEEALKKKERILLECPTQKMTAAMDEFYRMKYDLEPSFFLNTLQNTSLKQTLVRNYLGQFAAARATITYPNGQLPNRDWDGESIFDSVRLLDEATYDAIQHYMVKVVGELNTLAYDSLDEIGKVLKSRVLFSARAMATGALGGGNFGDGDMESACYVVGLDYDVLGGYELEKVRPKSFADDDEVLSEVNAIYMHNKPLKWLDVGTVDSAINLGLCNASGLGNSIIELVGDPATTEVSKGMILVKNWWIERIRASKDAQNKCTVYSASDRARIWEAFSASQQFNNDGSSTMDGFRDELDAYIANKRIRYRDAARVAIKVFPDDSVLTALQAEQVFTEIDRQSSFGHFPSIIGSEIDKAQGTVNGMAAIQWENAVSTLVTRIGGNYGKNDTVRPDEEAEMKTMFEEVKAWVAHEYQGYPVDVAALFPKIRYVIDTHSHFPITQVPGVIVMGIGTERSKMEYYSWIIHELRHAVSKARIASFPAAPSDVGRADEGSGVAAEELLLESFVKTTVKDATAYALYMLDYGIRDARFAATTDATLQKYFRTGCDDASDLNTVDFAKDIAFRYGLTGPLAESVALRSHVGTQYLQYIQSGMWMVNEISFLQTQIDSGRRHRIDPFVLFACNLNVPMRDADFVSRLKACITFREKSAPGVSFSIDHHHNVLPS